MTDDLKTAGNPSLLVGIMGFRDSGIIIEGRRRIIVRGIHDEDGEHAMCGGGMIISLPAFIGDSFVSTKFVPE